MKFDYSLDFKSIDFRKQPELYRIGKGEQGVLSVEPYKSEILPFWKFATPEKARESSEKIYSLFLQYKEANDFIGMDMARKFLQMGITRSRRYANHPGGKKYDGPVPSDKKGVSGAHGRKELPKTEDPIKAECARIFQEKYLLAKNDEAYIALAQEHREQYENDNGSAETPKRRKPRTANSGD
ncbi:MAG TPA: DUF4385 domain-containing protein [Abditibacteriaceae bacterium]|jgi:hypothetical protein